MVTGVRSTRGASVTTVTVKGYKGMLKVGLDATILTGVPVSGGPQVEMSNTNDRKVKYNGNSDYVFAYRVAKIQLRKDGSVKGGMTIRKGGTIQHR